MKEILLILFLILNALQADGVPGDTCIDKGTASEAGYHLKADPVTAIEIIAPLPDCDDKYALMHRANAEIARKCRSEFYYGKKIRPRGTGNIIPNRYERYLIEHPDQFNPAGEASPVTVNDYWIRKIKNRNHPVIADYRWDNLVLFFDSAWEDGDGDMHSYYLVRRFTEWINDYPDHVNVPEAEKRIKFMKAGKRYRIQETLVGTWTGELITTGPGGSIRSKNEIKLEIPEDDYSKGIFTDKTIDQSWEAKVFAAEKDIKMTFGFARRGFILASNGDGHSLSIEYKLKLKGDVCDNKLVLKKK